MEDVKNQDLQQFMYQDLRKRNKRTIYTFTVTVVLSLLMALALQVDFMFGALIVIPGALFVGAMSLMHWKQKGEQIAPYVAIAGIFYMSAITVLLSDSYISLLMAFYLLANGVMYNKRSIVLTGFVAGLVFIVFKYAAYPPLETQLMSVAIFYYIIVAVVLLSQNQIGGQMYKQIIASQTATAALLQQEQERDRHTQEATKTIAGSMKDIRSNSEENDISFKEMNNGFQDITSGMLNQSESMGEISNSIVSSNQSLERMLQALSVLIQRVDNTKQTSAEGSTVMESLMETINQFHEDLTSTKSDIEQLIGNIHEISSFNATIQEIASQTNLLSLNASIEAARAGEHGKGFGVVALEIRKLADLASHAASQISENLTTATAQADRSSNMMITNAQSMEKSLTLVRTTRQAFQEIDSNVEELALTAQGIETDMGLVAASSTQIEKAINEFAAVIEQATATLEELTATVENLTAQNTPLVARIQETDRAILRLVKQDESA